MLKWILVCGGRNYGGRPWMKDKPLHDIVAIAALEECLRLTWNKHPDAWMVQGGAKGADWWAKQWAERNGIPCLTMPANWTAFGKRAGSERNERMLALGIHGVVAFPGGAGTAHMMRIARAANVPVWEALKT